jgi:hypothetical protein
MKKLVMLSLILFSLYAHGQKRSSIAISYSLGNGTIGSFYKGGSPNNEQKSLNIFGLNYWHEMGKNLYFETGFQLIEYNYDSRGFPPNAILTNRTMNMISIPLKLRFEAGNYIFFNGGLTADVSRSKPDLMSGIGAGIGIGLQVKTLKQISLYVNPQANMHGIITSNRFFAEANITFGAAYRIQ